MEIKIIGKKFTREDKDVFFPVALLNGLLLLEKEINFRVSEKGVKPLFEKEFTLSS